MKVKEGDYVKIIARECTSADVKTGMFYGYFGGLCGTVDRIYDEREVCLRVDPATLPEDVLKRHVETQESIKKKWLNGLSGEARNRLTPGEKRFQLSYTILVQSADLEKAKKDDNAVPRPVAIKAVKPLGAPMSSSAATESAVKEKPAPKKESVAEQPAKNEPVAAKADPAPTAVKVEEKPAAKAEAKPAPSARKAAPKSESAPAESNGDLTPAELEFLREREKAMKAKK